MAKRKFTRPKMDPRLTEERFTPVQARQVTFVIRALTNDYPPKARKGMRPLSGGRLTEFEVWTAGEEPRNVALASNGGKAEGARSAVAEDFPEAYGPQLCIDGKFG